MEIGEKLSISYLKDGYAKGDFTPLDVCQAIVERAKETENMNIWIQSPDMDKMQKYLDNLKNLDQEKAKLWGIPFAIKDNIDLEGVMTTAGCPTYGYMPEENATTVDLLIKEGAIPVGKTNMDQFATGLVGTRSLYGETHNSLREELISGGSSSGSAVSVAMGLCSFALGTDTAGSGRVPAALNDLVGFKPTVGAWSVKGVVPACASLDCVTVFTNDLEDAILVDSIERVHDRSCAWSKEVKPVQPGLPKKILIPNETPVFYGAFKDAYEGSWKRFLADIEGLGIEIEKIDYSMFSKAASILYDGPWIAERWAALGDFVEKNDGKDMVKVTEQILRSGGKSTMGASDLFKSIHELQGYKSQVKELLKDSVLLMPTCGGTFTIEEVNQDPIRTNSEMGLYTNHCNLLDLSALAFQAGYADHKLPFGITSFALSEEDGLNVGLAKLYQRAGEDQCVELAVCGQHMRGMALSHQLTDLKARFDREDKTAPEYRLYKLNSEPVKPGLIHVTSDGASIEVEIWKMPIKNLGKFLKGIPAPLLLGKITLSDDQEVIGFLCEGYGIEGAQDVTEYGNFKKAIQG